MNYYYLLIGKTPASKKIDILIDNATKNNAKPAPNGMADINEEGITISSDSQIFDLITQNGDGYDSTLGK